MMDPSLFAPVSFGTLGSLKLPLQRRSSDNGGGVHPRRPSRTERPSTNTDVRNPNPSLRRLAPCKRDVPRRYAMSQSQLFPEPKSSKPISSKLHHSASELNYNSTSRTDVDVPSRTLSAPRVAALKEEMKKCHQEDSTEKSKTTDLGEPTNHNYHNNVAHYHDSRIKRHKKRSRESRTRRSSGTCGGGGGKITSDGIVASLSASASSLETKSPQSKRKTLRCFRERSMRNMIRNKAKLERELRQNEVFRHVLLNSNNNKANATLASRTDEEKGRERTKSQRHSPSSSTKKKKQRQQQQRKQEQDKLSLQQFIIMKNSSQRELLFKYLEENDNDDDDGDTLLVSVSSPSTISGKNPFTPDQGEAEEDDDLVSLTLNDLRSCIDDDSDDEDDDICFDAEHDGNSETFVCL